MGIYLDSANLEEIKNIMKYPFIDGVTTNPAIISKALEKSEVTWDMFEEHIRKIAKLAEGDIFVQTMMTGEEDMVKQAGKIHDILGDRGVIKIPASISGLKAIKILSSDGIRTAATAVFTAMQGYIAMLSGAEFVIPYYSRIDRSGQDGQSVIEDLMDIIEACDFETKILVASVKSSYDVLEIIRAGADAVTLPQSVISEIISNHQTDEAIVNFERALKIEQ